MYYEINEDLARRAHENHHIMTDYHPNQDTNEYRGYVDRFATEIAAAKEKASQNPEKCAQLDALLDRYARKLADWFNRKNSNDSRHVSWIVSGRSNYDMGRQEKWDHASQKLYEEFRGIQALSNKIDGIAYAERIIKSGDTDAIEKLEAKIASLREEHTKVKQANADARKAKQEPPYPYYTLPYILKEIKRLEARVASLRKAKTTTASPTAYAAVEGLEVVENSEIMRLQLIFDGKPSADVRAIVKDHGFIWSGKNMAWQRQLTDNARRAAKDVIAALGKAGLI